MTVTWDQDPFVAAVRRGALRGLVLASNDLRNEILRRILRTSKTGRVYVRRGIEHRASAPGEAPASDTGTLARNITVDIDTEKLTARINSGAAHSRMLEFGTPTIEPRPHLRVSLEAQRTNIQLTIEREIINEISTLGGARR